MNNQSIPLIKENRVDKIRKCIECIDKYAFSRNKQRKCILNLYPDKGKRLEQRDKSIFRGMVLPSLRYLGLTIGRGHSIRASANGKSIIESHSIDKELHKRVLRAIIYEVDKNRFHFMNTIRNSSSHNRESFVNELCTKIAGPSERQKRERISRWLSILRQVGLVDYYSHSIFINDKSLGQTINDVDVRLKNPASFKRHFLDAYFELAKRSAGIVNIAELRESVALKMLKNYRIILSENQFDQMLRKTILETDDYIVSLGKPMGARDKLFEYKGNYFRTIFIRPKRESQNESR